MMEAAPASPFVMAQPKFLFQFLIVALDNPPLFSDSNQILELCFCRQRRKPVFRRLVFSFRPFDKQPLFRMRFGLPVVAVCRTKPDCGKAGTQLAICPLSPCYGLRCLCR